ncbi:MAG TPA: tRNA 2-thiouridine(34) synthase MnmA [Bacillota bacterium]|nr:tRNA 2-thiouridine(34) synthase MnmA [Bacillota bacterium]
MKIIIGLSGGVDSSVAALLLKRQGYEVEGLFMRNWDSLINSETIGAPTTKEGICPQEKDYLDALTVAKKLGIRLHRHDFVDRYWDDVFQYFLKELDYGRTPNPDILCNKYIKFSAFLDVAKALGADKIAMGHYARVTENGVLLRGVDPNKDQSYFLAELSRDELLQTMFPIGNLTKKEVREIAKKEGFSVAEKKGSTGICFIGERNFPAFIGNYLKPREGRILSSDKNILGRHRGIANFTIGQRKGLGIGGCNIYEGSPWFVYAKDVKNNDIYVCQGFYNDLLMSDRCLVTDFNWIGGVMPDDINNLSAKFRYRQKDVAVNLSKAPDNSVMVMYPEKSRAVTPGQECVIYRNDECLGGGTIDKVFLEDNPRTVVI